MGMMNLGGGRGTIGMPVPQGARWLGQPAGPRPAQVNEQMQTQVPTPQQLPPGPMPPPQPGVLGGQAGPAMGAPQLPSGGMGNPWAQQPPPQMGVGGPPMQNPLARLLAGR